jgi:voltage-gated potassium channel
VITLRKKVYRWLEDDESRIGWLINTVIMVLIVISVVAIIFESEPEIAQRFSVLFQIIEITALFVFTVEYLVRAWVSVENPKYHKPVAGRIRYLLTPMAIIDLIAILPVYLFLFGVGDARYWRILRLLRVIKLTRHFSGLNILMSVLHRELPSLMSALCIMLVLIVLSSGGIYIAEHQAQPQVFDTMMKTMWWSVVTLTTIGYGDMIPITPIGKFFGSIVALLGVGLAALPAGIVAAGFNNELQRRREHYQLHLRKALENGSISASDRAHLMHIRKKLGLGLEDVDQVNMDETLHILEDHKVCPHCGKDIER